MSYPTNPGGWPDPSPAPGQPAQPGPHQPPPPPGHPAAGPPGYGYGGYPPPGYPPPGYAPPGYPPPGYPILPKTNGTAVASMVVSIASAAFLMCGFCLGPLMVLSLGGGITGAALGFVARRHVRDRGERGDGMALSGIIVGFIAAALGALWLIVTVVLLGFQGSYGSSF